LHRGEPAGGVVVEDPPLAGGAVEDWAVRPVQIQFAAVAPGVCRTARSTNACPKYLAASGREVIRQDPGDREFFTEKE